MAAALLFGAGVEAAGTANAAVAGQPGTAIAAKSWHYAAHYSSEAKCIADGHTADVPWQCRKSSGSGYSLYLYY
ncbi:hypothetical protein LE181_01795 [Streptomyces sp. SCA3-4]|uniref:hypothetical protein n=1 Tax=Streptomyces sichuanensis TaxID=2871810 RepID=UPI001CE388FD|nr:hypothetical protein [Streptomyces sichuanensis]MCA6090913.1 hypothetical protein [Streptomyces sichuanensis]